MLPRFTVPFEFVFSEHAKQRFNERYGSGDMLEIVRGSRKAGPKLRKTIRKTCPFNGTKDDHFYYVNRWYDKQRNIVFVCQLVKPDEMRVKTVFVTNPEITDLQQEDE